MGHDVDQALKNERAQKVIREILELNDAGRIRVLLYVVARAELGGWLEYLEQETERQRTGR